MAYFIKDFSKFQHFKDRTPPWVKLYRDILDDPDWHELPPEAAKVLVMLWVIASEDDTKRGMLPEVKKLAFRLRITEKNLRIILSQLSHWLIQDDIDVISDGYQLDAPERAGEETETETETDAPKSSAKFDFLKSLIANGVSEQVAKDYIATRKVKKCVQTETAFNGLIKESEKSGLSLADIASLCCKKGWGSFDASWLKPEDAPKATVHQMPSIFAGAR